MKWLELKVPPPLLGLAVAAGMWALGPTPVAAQAGAPWWSPVQVTSSGWLMLAALFIVTGLMLDVFSVLKFVQSRTTVNPLRPQNTRHFVASGPYRFTRNPMYLGMLLVLTGCALWLGHWIAWPLLAIFPLYITRFQIMPEERFMEAQFGESYLEYKKKVRRWL